MCRANNVSAYMAKTSKSQLQNDTAPEIQASGLPMLASKGTTVVADIDEGS